MSGIERIENLFRTVLEEARANPAFGKRLIAVMEGSDSGLTNHQRMSPSAGKGRHEGKPSSARRHRRPPGVVNPTEAISRGEGALRADLDRLDNEQLKDIIAEHGMDTRKLAMKWKDRQRLIDLIVGFTHDRLAKGAVFRTPPTEPTGQEHWPGAG